MGDVYEIMMSKWLLKEMWCEGVEWIKLVQFKVDFFFFCDYDSDTPFSVKGEKSPEQL